MIDLRTSLRREPLKSFGTLEAALALCSGHLIYAVQLLHQSLLVCVRQPSEVRVVAKQPFLILEGHASMLIQPGAQVAGRVVVRRPVATVRRTRQSLVRVR